VLVHVRDASKIETHHLEFEGSLVLALEPPFTLHDRAQWELAPDAVEGKRRVYDLGVLMGPAPGPTVRAGTHVILELELRRDHLGWHLAMSGPGGVRSVPLPDFDPESSTGLGVTARTLN
jgi:hypothetical protein